MDRQRILEFFPVLKKITYLDTSSDGIPPVPVKHAIDEYLQARMQVRISFKQILDMFEETRALLAKLLGGTPGNYAFMGSTTDAINAIANAISYPPGSNIVICDLEFPANYLPWQNIAKITGSELRVVKSSNGAATVDDFAKLVDENTRMVSVSHVQFSTGYKIDLAGLTAIAHEHGALTCADIIQSAGVVDVDLPSTGVDFAAGQATKYLCGPVGAGYLYMRDGVDDVEEIRPRYMGWWGVEDMEDFSFKERVPLKDARRFQVGSSAIICYHGLRESLKVLLEFKGKKRERAAMECADALRDGLRERGIPFHDFDEESRSHVVSCKVPDPEGTQRRLLKKRVYTSERAGRLRLSCHFYNHPGDADNFLRAL